MVDSEVAFLYSIYKSEDKTLEGTRKRFLSNPADIDDLYIEIHDQLAYIFAEIKRLCDENDINYFLMGGSCIGALRSGRIIPWDTDGDIGMTRSDYERFKIAVDRSDKISISEVFRIGTNSNKSLYGHYTRKVYIGKRKGSTAVSVDIILWDRIDIPTNLSISKFWEEYSTYRENYPEEENAGEEYFNLVNQNFLDKYGSETGYYLVWSLDNFISLRAVIKERVLKYDTVFPLKDIDFLNSKYKVCNDVDTYITQEWGNIWDLHIPALVKNERRNNLKLAVEKNRDIINGEQ